MKSSNKGFAHIFLLAVLALGMIVLVYTVFQGNFDIREKAASGERGRPTFSPKPKNTSKPRVVKTPTPLPITR